MLSATLNEAIPLRVLASDGRSDLFVQLRIYNSVGTEVTALSAGHVAEGMYSATWTPSIEGYFTLIGQLYYDNMFSVPAGYEKVAESIDVNAVKTNILRILGLHHENSVVDLQGYDVNNNLTSARVRLFDSKASAQAAGVTGLVAQYTISATYDSQGRLSNYRMVLEP